MNCWTDRHHYYTQQTKKTLTALQTSAHLSLLTRNGNAAVFVVLDRGASLLDQSAIASGCEEGWNPSTPCSDPLCESTLWKKKKKVTDNEKSAEITFPPRS